MAPAAAEAARTLRRVGDAEFVDMATLLGLTGAGPLADFMHQPASALKMVEATFETNRTCDYPAHT
jgi:hypothetical protein